MVSKYSLIGNTLLLPPPQGKYGNGEVISIRILLHNFQLSYGRVDRILIFWYSNFFSTIEVQVLTAESEIELHIFSTFVALL